MQYLREKVPPERSDVDSLPATPSCCSLFSSTAISKTERPCTPLMLGTSKPIGVSMARAILWEALKVIVSACGSKVLFKMG